MAPEDAAEGFLLGAETCHGDESVKDLDEEGRVIVTDFRLFVLFNVSLLYIRVVLRPLKFHLFIR